MGDLLNSSSLTSKSVDMNDATTTTTTTTTTGNNTTSSCVTPGVDMLEPTSLDQPEATLSVAHNVQQVPDSCKKEDEVPEVVTPAVAVTSPAAQVTAKSALAAIAPSVFDDGYGGSTGSLKNATTNESLSSIDDSSELSSSAAAATSSTSSQFSSTLVSTKVALLIFDLFNFVSNEHFLVQTLNSNEHVFESESFLVLNVCVEIIVRKEFLKNHFVCVLKNSNKRS